MPFRRLRSLLLVAAAAAGVAGCGGGDSPLAAMRHTPNATDRAFLRAMTDHEQKTLGIPRLAERRALRRELRGISRTMTAERQENLRKLGSLSRGTGTGSGPPPAAWRSPSSALRDLSRVKDATSFDHEFMRTMIEQNQRAMTIANREAALGSDPATKRLALAISSQRRKELDRLHAWLRLWYGEIQPSPGPGPGPPGGGGGGTVPRPGPSAPHSGGSVPL